MEKLFFFGFDHWLIFGCDDWPQVAKCLFWESREWNNTASARVELRNSRRQWAMSTCQFPMLEIVFVSTYIRSIEWCACRYVLFMLQWANLAIGGVESSWCTVLDHYNLNFKTQQSHCQRAKPGFFYFFLCISQKFLLTHPHGDLVILTIPVNRTQSFPVGAQKTITVS